MTSYIARKVVQSFYQSPQNETKRRAFPART